MVVGTRPEIVKMSPIVWECQRSGIEFFILHTGQHYSDEMDRVFFEQLQLPDAEYNLNVGSGSHGVQTGKMLTGIEEVLRKERPEVVLVEGDTNTVLSGALAAVKLGFPVGHVESGLRSYDRRMPEEVNRVLTSTVSGLSVLSLIVTHGIPRMHASSWTPPESVIISLAPLSSPRKLR